MDKLTQLKHDKKVHCTNGKFTAVLCLCLSSLRLQVI
jgi:hypothetical protein